MSACFTRAGQTFEAHEEGLYSCELPVAPLGSLPGELTAALALAAVETLTRLGRLLPIHLDPTGAPVATSPSPGEGRQRLDGWSEGLRRLPGPQARAEVRRLLAPLLPETATHDGAVPAFVVTVADGSLTVPEPAEPVRGVRVRYRIEAGSLTVAVEAGLDDPWSAIRVVVAEVFGQVLANLLADPSAACRQVEGIGERSRARVLGELAGTAVDDGPFEAIPTMIESMVDRHPERPALSYGGRTLTYRQLDEVANGLAGVLADAGVGRGDLVPVLLANSLEMPIAYLALMKIAAAFVPLDPAWPADRIRATVDVLSPGLVICADAHSLPGDRRDLALPVKVDLITAQVKRPAVAVGPDDPIYGIFTSGTTGTPKCAVNSHRGLTNRFRFMTRYFAADGSEVVLQNSRHTFDSSVWQLFWPLTVGGRTVIPAQGEFLDLEHTIETIHTYGVTMTDFVPSIFNALVSMVDGDERALAGISSLRQLVVGGEEINPQMAHRLAALLPGVRVTNGYGPTEASIGMVFHPVAPQDESAIPLGRPIDNCYVVILDDDLRLLPPGATGEIVIGGRCLGVGYLGDPERTAGVFVANPFPQVPGERLYRTGDLGRFAPDGRLFFLGRRDFQVKIGGVRIELGEIEVVTDGCPGVRQSKVLVAQQGTARSLAVFAAGDDRLTEAALRDHLRRSLPRTSVPRHCFVLPELPLTDNGKVDRQWLQAMLDRTLAGNLLRLAEATPAHPGKQEDQAEQVDPVLSILRSTLGQPDLRAGDDVLRAGCDSIQALSATQAISAACGVRIGVQDLFATPTAAALSALVERRTAEQRSADQHAVEQRTAEQRVPAQRGTVMQTAGQIAAAEESALMEQDSALPEGFEVRAVDPGLRAWDLRTVLVTGATGFVGGRLVHELLTRTELRVICVCRAEDTHQARSRLISSLVEQGLWQAEFAERLEVHPGDLGRPLLGLTPALWDHLARVCDVILHNGALVNFLFDYRAHRAANVVGTREVLRLAMAHRPKPLHHISTLGTLDSDAVRRGERVPETMTAGAVDTVPTSGYSRSKWVAERLLDDARARGALVTVYRLGEVMPAADNGYPNHRSLTHLLLSAFHRLAMCPGTAARSDYTPVDYVARRVVAGLLDREVWGRTLHVFHPESVCFGDVLSRVGSPIFRVPGGQFMAGLVEAARDTGDRELATLLALLRVREGADEATISRIFAELFTDNTRLFGKDECAGLERRWGMTDEWLNGPIAAYRSHLSATSSPVDRIDNTLALQASA